MRFTRRALLFEWFVQPEKKAGQSPAFFMGARLSRCFGERAAR